MKAIIGIKIIFEDTLKALISIHLVQKKKYAQHSKSQKTFRK